MLRATLFAAVLLVPVTGLLDTAQLAAQATLAVRGGASIVDSRTGLNLGASVTFPFLGNLDLQASGAYVQRGATATGPGGSVIFAIDYVEISGLLSIGVPLGGAISPHFLVGPAFAFKTGCELEGSPSSCADVDVNIQWIDVGAVGGMGVDIGTSGAISITLDVLYTAGLVPIEKEAGNARNRTWSILAGAALSIG